MTNGMPMMTRIGRILAALALGAGALCTGGCTTTQASPEAWQPGYTPDLEVAVAPYDSVAVNWKQRLAYPYVYLDGVGSYALTGQRLTELLREAESQGFEATGPPFALFYDDPGLVEADRLISRVCLPVAGPTTPQTPLRAGVLESTTVVYGFVAGPYGDAPRAYPALMGYMSSMNWEISGPIREIYLVPPARQAGTSGLVAEIQIPVRPAR